MGATQSSNCILFTLEHQTLAHKIKSTCHRMSHAKKENNQKKINAENISKEIKKPERKSNRRIKILAPMPRCSSMESLNTLLSPSKKPVNDPCYNGWKKHFENPPVIDNEKAIRKRPFEFMKEAVAGQITPKGFPWFTDARIAMESTKVADKCFHPRKSRRNQCIMALADILKSKHNHHNNNMSNKTKNILNPYPEEYVQRRLSLRLPMLTTLKATLNLSKHKEQHKKTNMNKENYYSPDKPYFLSKVSKQEANAIEKLYKEIKDMEEYYAMPMSYYYL